MGNDDHDGQMFEQQMVRVDTTLMPIPTTTIVITKIAEMATTRMTMAKMTIIRTLKDDEMTTTTTIVDDANDDDDDR